jgi:hypothetical protein
MASLVDVKISIDQIMGCLSDIKVEASNILKKLEPVMKNIKDSNSDIVVQCIKKYPQYKDGIHDTMQNITVEWIKDASTVMSEIDNFIKVTDEGFIFQMESCPFLAEVWTGDAYDRHGLEGLKELKIDLTKQFSDINRDNLFTLAAKRIKESA